MLMILIYNLLLVIPSILSIPISYIFLEKEEFLSRYAFKLPKIRNPVWFHCASLGELNAIKPLIKEFIKLNPQTKILITTTSRTGLKAARKITLNATFLPIDFYPLVRRFIHKIEPKMLIIAETEFWPNLFFMSKNIIIINARISDKTLGKYKLFSKLFKGIFKNVKSVCAQSEEDKNKFLVLGFSDVQNFGNLKFAVNLKQIDKHEMRKKLGYKENDYIIVWGSSRPGEEKIIIDLFPTLKEIIKNLKLIIVPRHLKRLSEVKKLAKIYSLFSTMQLSPKDIMIVDKMGILTDMYAISDISIIGGSFYNFGGHNPLEAIFYAKPTIIGEFHSSCKDSVNTLKRENAIIIADKTNLLNKILFLYKNKAEADKLGKNGIVALKKNSQSLIKTLNCIKKRLGEK